MTSAAVAAITLGLAYLLRVLPFRLGPPSLGTDHWFWKAWVEAYRRERKFPPVLPQFLLDEHQWYPPVFPLLLARAPSGLFERHNRLVAVAIDLARMALLLAMAAWLSGGQPAAIALAGVTYATAPILVAYNVQLNPRGLGALLLDALVALLLWAHTLDQAAWVWAAAALLAAGILLTHKMTTQLFWFLALGASFLFLDWRVAALIPASALLALGLSRGFYWNVLRAHWDVVSFWHRNWRWLQAHPLKESPIYGDPSYETSTKLHRRGLAGVVRHLGYLAGLLPAGWIAGVLVAGGAFPAGAPPAASVGAWLVLSLLFALVTTFLPVLRCLGSGYYYLYNAAFPAALLWALAAGREADSWALYVAFGVQLVASAAALAAFYRRMSLSRLGREDMDGVMDYLRAAPPGPVMCLPAQPYDMIGYRTGQPVLWGAHGYGFRRVEPIYPRLLLSISALIERYGVRYVAVRKGYVPQRFLEELGGEVVFDGGGYLVYRAPGAER